MENDPFLQEIFDSLIPAGDVIEALAREHDRRGTYADWEVCKRAALDTVIYRLKNGNIIGWATACEIDCDHPTATVPDGQLFATWDMYFEKNIAKIPVEFWMHFHNATDNYREIDIVSGDFRYAYNDDNYSCRNGHAFAVHFHRNALPPLNAPTPEWTKSSVPLSKVADIGQSVSEPASSNRGRKPANWWPDFAEELAMYCLKDEPPDGAGTEGQSEMIAAIFARMAERGKPEPSRTSVQPVVNEILRRWRSAGN